MEKQGNGAAGNFNVNSVVLYSQVFRKAGIDPNGTEEKGSGVDLTGAFVRFDIEEGLETGLVRGAIDVLDVYNLTSGAGLNGTEFIAISFGSKTATQEEDAEFVKNFRVVRYEDLPDSKTMLRKMTRFHVVSEHEAVSDSILVSKSYHHKGIDFIVSDLLRVIGVPDSKKEIERTKHNKSIVIPSITPLSAIAHLGQSCISSEHNDPNFYFFESRDKINFISLTSIKNKEPVAELYLSADTGLSNYNKILQWKRDRGYNLQDQLRNGGVVTTTVTHSLVDKRVSATTSHLYEQSTDKVNIGGKSVLLIAKSKDYAIASYNGYEIDGIGHKQLVSGDQMYGTDKVDLNNSIAGQRRLSRTSLYAKRAFATVAGNTNITAGSVVKVVAIDQNGDDDKSNNGLWVVSKVVHMVTKENYFMNLELISDSNARGGEL